MEIESRKQVFISHSSKDKKLITFTKLAFTKSRIEPYFASQQVEGKEPVIKIIDAIDRAVGLFAYITPNGMDETKTRDWINFELGAAKMKGISIFCLIDSKLVETGIPELIKNLTDYSWYDFSDDKGCDHAVRFVLSKAESLEISAKSPVESDKKALRNVQEKSIPIDEAQSIANNYLFEKCRPDFYNTEYSSANFEAGLWILRGRITKSIQTGRLSEDFEITIKGNEVASVNLSGKTAFTPKA